MKSVYVEHDLACATFLRVKGHKFNNLIPLNHGRLAFEFAEDETGTCAADALSFWQGASVPAERFAHVLRQMKQELRGYKQTESEKDEKQNACRKILQGSCRP